MTEEEKIRYSRLVTVETFGFDGLTRLKSGKVLIIGCGALGSVCAMYLAASGVGVIGIADFDTVDVSNLQRQIFYTEKEVGKEKGLLLKEKISLLNSSTTVNLYSSLITREKAKTIFPQYDIIIDATDNPASKIMVDTVCHELSKPYCIGGVKGFEGQIMSWSPGHVRYSDIFPDAACDGGILPCTVHGVMGPLPGVIASMQALEAIKHISGKGDMLYDKLLVMNLFDLKIDLIDLV